MAAHSRASLPPQGENMRLDIKVRGFAWSFGVYRSLETDPTGKAAIEVNLRKC